MAIWQDEIDEIISLVETLKETAEGIEGRNTHESDYLERIAHVCEHIVGTLKSFDPLLIPTTHILAALRKHVAVIQSSIDTLRANDAIEAEELKNQFGPAIELLLRTLANIPPIGDTAGSREVERLRRSIGQHISHTERIVTDVTAAADIARQNMVNEFDLIDKKRNALAAGLDSQQQDLNRLEVLITENQKKQDDLIDKMMGEFQGSQEQRQGEFSREFERVQGRLTNVVDDYQQQFEASISAVHDALNEEREAAKKTNEAIDDILGLVNDKALVGSHSINADEDKKQASIWRWVAFGSGIAAVCLAMYLAFIASTQHLEWYLLTSKMVVAVTIGGIATYAGRQSAEHRNAQREAQHVAVQLKTIGPYLRQLRNEEDHDQILALVATRLFGQPRNTNGYTEGLRFTELPLNIGQRVETESTNQS